MIKPIERILHSLLLLIFIGTSGSIVYYVKTTPSVTPAALFTPTPVASLAPVVTSTAPLIPTPVPGLSSPVGPTREIGWSLLQPGLERRVIDIYDNQDQHIESLHIWRLDQKYFRLDVAFDETPKSLETWQRETNAAIVLNGGYYSIEDEKYSPDGLTVLNGEPFGKSFHGFGGMLAINQARAELRWLVEKPYNSAEPLQAALQSFPILVKPGGQLGFSAARENYARARRTAIGQDQDGRILLIVAPEGYFTLHQLSRYLTESDLNLDIAINLDGGGSTGILVASPRDIIPADRPLPFVVLVYPR